MKHGHNKLHFLQPPELLDNISEFLTANEWLVGVRKTCRRLYAHPWVENRRELSVSIVKVE